MKPSMKVKPPNWIKILCLAMFLFCGMAMKMNEVVMAQIYHTSNGNVGIGTTNPTHSKLEIHGSGAQALTIKSTNRWAYLTNDDTYLTIGSDVGMTGIKAKFHLSSPDNSFILDSSGNVGIGTTSPNSAKLVVAQTGGNTGLSLYSVWTKNS